MPELAESSGDLPLIVVCTAQDTNDIGVRELLVLLVRQNYATPLPLRPLTATEVPPV